MLKSFLRIVPSLPPSEKRLDAIERSIGDGELGRELRFLVRSETPALDQPFGLSPLEQRLGLAARNVARLGCRFDDHGGLGLGADELADEPLGGAFGIGCLFIAVVLSNLVSNVPAMLLFKPLTDVIPHPEQAWLTLAMSSTFAGNLTLLGSVANLIVVETARKAGIEIRRTDASPIKSGSRPHEASRG